MSWICIAVCSNVTACSSALWHVKSSPFDKSQLCLVICLYDSRGYLDLAVLQLDPCGGAAGMRGAPQAQARLTSMPLFGGCADSFDNGSCAGSCCAGGGASMPSGGNQVASLAGASASGSGVVAAAGRPAHAGSDSGSTSGNGNCSSLARGTPACAGGSCCEGGSGLIAGRPVFVVGHGLFGPAAALHPSFTAGCIAKAVRLPAEEEEDAAGSSAGAADSARPYGGGGAVNSGALRGGAEGRDARQRGEDGVNADASAAGSNVACRAMQGTFRANGAFGASGAAAGGGGRVSMLITTAAVHRGASGGAVLDAASGALAGLVTSNARHASGTTLPDINFR